MANNLSSNNKRIAKNATALYIRMFIMMGVGLYTSRVVLEALGETNYGIYNLIGGVVVLFSFLNQALTSATQRFLNFHIGRNEECKVNEIFCMSMNSYIILSLLFLLLAETIGLWFVDTKLNIPPSRMNAALWTYQLSILTFIINLLRIPYNASIIAYEKMNFFAYISLIEVFLKLGIVYLLFISSFDRLIYYTGLIALVTLIINVLYLIYCRRNFAATKMRIMWHKETFNNLFSFSGWSLFGSLANVGVSQGLNILVNFYYGVILNASLGIANQVVSHINQFVTNFQTAFNPQLVKSYAANEIDRFNNLICTSSKFSYYLLLIISLPVMLTIDTILNIWLTEVPIYTGAFCQMILIFSLIMAFSAPLWMSVQATGKIKTYQILMSSVIILNLPLAWICLYIGFNPVSVWGVRCLVEVLVIIVRLIYMKRMMNFPVLMFIRKSIIPIFSVTLLCLPIPIISKIIIQGYWINFISVVAISVITSTIIIFYFGLQKSEQEMAKSFVKNFINKFHTV